MRRVTSVLKGSELKIYRMLQSENPFLRYDLCMQAYQKSQIQTKKRKGGKRPHQKIASINLHRDHCFTINGNDGPTNHIIPSSYQHQPFLKEQQHQSSLHNNRRQSSKPSQCHWTARELFRRIRTIASRSRRILGRCCKQSPLVHSTKDHTVPIRNKSQHVLVVF